uniref:N-acetylmuramoyl-L-alanine amidase n=1 Tax=Cyanothece sp. (strain PCC 7425 / ATCC 29141) TaxID=395961 RepID=B8HSE7_CYAP4
MLKWQWRQGIVTLFFVAVGLLLAILVGYSQPAFRSADSGSLSARSGVKIEYPVAEIKTGLPLPSDRTEVQMAAACLPPQRTPTALSFQAKLVTPEPSRAVPKYKPQQRQEKVHPTNYGNRMQRDVHHRRVNNELLVVLHETVGDAHGAISTFQTPHYDDDNQVSYHAVISRNGTVIYLVPANKRAYGAGNSEFIGINGVEAVQTNPSLASSVNNFAYHISLETPVDGLLDDHPEHSGYTQKQYQSLAWLIARTGVATSRITTHAAIDREGARQDPRSFSFPKLLSYLNQYPRPTEIPPCPLPPQG